MDPLHVGKAKGVPKVLVHQDLVDVLGLGVKPGSVEAVGGEKSLNDQLTLVGNARKRGEVAADDEVEVDKPRRQCWAEVWAHLLPERS